MKNLMKRISRIGILLSLSITLLFATLGQNCCPINDPDTDSDGLCDSKDNCPSIPNPGQENCNGDHEGDACEEDSAEQDGDEDGICNEVDNCSETPNGNQADRDNDGFGDMCDNCPFVLNPGQEDLDRDGFGDACLSEGMVLVPAGKFVRGACNEENTDNDAPCDPGELGYDPEAREGESPVREIVLNSYWIDRTEVTKGEYRQCVNAPQACTTPETAENCIWEVQGLDNHPINCVTWFQAQAYCMWKEKRLPTEAEWEKAARGGCETGGDSEACEPGSDDRKWPWGNNTPTCNDAFANFGSCVGSTTPVGSYPAGASPYGALDMAGNLFERVADFFDAAYYRPDFPRPDFSPSENPQGPQDESVGISRGGSWSHTATELRSALRNTAGRETALSPRTGFRCARTDNF